MCCLAAIFGDIDNKHVRKLYLFKIFLDMYRWQIRCRVCIKKVF